MHRIWQWLLPGLRVKRWLALVVAGMALAIWGLAGLWPELVAAPGPFWAGLSVVTGLGLLLMAGRQALFSITSAVMPREEDRLVEVLVRRRQRGKGPRLVAIGGGTGLSVLLRGLKEYTENITAVVTVTDEGGSSGRLRQELGMPPPGDIRNCLVALADTEPQMEKLFQYRFRGGGSLGGHTLGNLLLAGLTEELGDFQAAVKEASRVLAVRGEVLPATLENVSLEAELADGTVVRGETTVTESEGAIRQLDLVPENPRALPEAVEAIEKADAIVMGPGSLYTSILPNLLVPELAKAVRRSQGHRFYVCNVMTQPGETDGYSAADHLQALEQHVGESVVDVVVVNTEPAPVDLLRKYREEGAYPVEVDEKRLRLGGVQVEKGRLISKQNLVRHDPDRLGQFIMRLLVKRAAQNR